MDLQYVRIFLRVVSVHLEVPGHFSRCCVRSSSTRFCAVLPNLS